MKTVEVAAAVIFDSLASPHTVFATARGYGDYAGDWEFPGGKLEAGETAAAAAVREIKEELDTDITVGGLIRTIEYDYPAFHLTMHCVSAEIRSGTPVLKEAKAAKWLDAAGLSSVKWLPADELLIGDLQRLLK